YHQELVYQNQELIRIQRVLEESENKFKSLFFDAPIGYVIYKSSGRMELFNSSFNKMISPGKKLEKGDNITKHISPEFQDAFYLHIKKLEMNGKDNELELKFIVNNKKIDVKVMSSILEINKEKFVKSTFMDISEIKEINRRIEYLSYRDQLTGAYNRRYFNEELKRLDTKRNLPLSIIIADVNGLKIINDTFGHDVGDKILKGFVKTTKGILRSDEIIARMGGDEFAILLPSCEKKYTENIIKRIKENVEEKEIEGLKISVALGYSTKIDNKYDIDKVKKDAEDIMYKDKIFDDKSKKRKVVLTMLTTLHERYKEEEEHSKRVSELSYSIGKAMKLSEERIKLLKMAGLLHDIGKIAIDYNIINKAEKLTIDEYNEVKKHTEVGYRILNSVPEFSDIALIVLHHHENINGTGYPRNLKGINIPLESRIVKIVDAYDAMISDRPYKKKMKKNKAIDELVKNSGKEFDKKIVNIFVNQILNA
ncbi:MAG: diguanylate cyclase, partial [Bacillota bacterium]|nr:diguanylate cyclase [Bacillota bacterium]